MKSKILEDTKKFFKPEFLNRIDDVIIFHPLSLKHIEKVAKLMMNKLETKVQESGYQIEIKPSAIKKIANLGYNPESQTKEVVENIFSGTDLLQYSDYYMQAATYDGNNISPISLAARSRQEVVLPGGKLSDSANGQGKINDVVYYNFYNIGAFSTCSNPIECALDFAKGYDENYTSYDRPWTTPEKAILNGAKYIANGYINVGQNTLYFQKFDVENNKFLVI